MENNQPSVQPSVSPPQKHFIYRKWFWFAGVLFIVLILFFAPIPYYQNATICTMSFPSTCTSIGWHLGQSLFTRSFQRQAPTSSTTDTVSWKTYTNTEYGFSFDYPLENMTLIESTKSASGDGLTKLKTVSLIIPNSDGSGSITIWDNPKGFTPSQWWESTYDMFYANKKDSTFGDPIKKVDFKLTNEKIGNMELFHPRNGKLFSNPYFIQHDNYIFQFSNISSEILKTFKFTQ